MSSLPREKDFLNAEPINFGIEPEKAGKYVRADAGPKLSRERESSMLFFRNEGLREAIEPSTPEGKIAQQLEREEQARIEREEYFQALGAEAEINFAWFSSIGAVMGLMLPAIVVALGFVPLGFLGVMSITVAGVIAGLFSVAKKSLEGYELDSSIISTAVTKWFAITAGVTGVALFALFAPTVAPMAGLFGLIGNWMGRNMSRWMKNPRNLLYRISDRPNRKIVAKLEGRR